MGKTSMKLFGIQIINCKCQVLALIIKKQDPPFGTIIHMQYTTERDLRLYSGNREEWEHIIHNMRSTKSSVFLLLTMKALHFFSACFCRPLQCCTSDLELLKMPNTIKIQGPVSVTQLQSPIVPSDTHGTRKISHTYCMKFHIGELHCKFY